MVDRKKRRAVRAGVSYAPPGSKPVITVEGRIEDRRCWIKVLLGSEDAIDPSTSKIVEARLTEVRALIDTGATGAVINANLAVKLGVKARTKGVCVGLSGDQACEMAPLIVGFRSPQGTLIFKIVQVSIAPHTSVPVLFGMNEIVPGTLTVYGARGTWKWELRENVIPRSP